MTFESIEAQNKGCYNFPIQNGNESILYSYDGIELLRTTMGVFMTNYGENYFIVRDMGNFGILDRNGNIRLKLEYKNINECQYNKNRFIITSNESVFVIDLRKDEMIIPESDKYNKIYEIDSNNYITILKNEAFYINTKDSIKIEIEKALESPGYYISSYRFQDLFLLWDAFEGSLVIDINGNSLYKSGHKIVDFSPDKSLYLSNSNDTFLVLSKDGDIIRTFICQRANFINNRIIKYFFNNKYYLFDPKSNIVSTPYKNIYYLNDSLFHCAHSKRKHGIINMKFEIVEPFKYETIGVAGSDSQYFVLGNKQGLIIKSINNKVIYMGKAYNFYNNGNYSVLQTEDGKFSLFSIKFRSVLLSGYDYISISYDCDLVKFNKSVKSGFYHIRDNKFFFNSY